MEDTDDERVAQEAQAHEGEVITPDRDHVLLHRGRLVVEDAAQVVDHRVRAFVTPLVAQGPVADSDEAVVIARANLVPPVPPRVVQDVRHQVRRGVLQRRGGRARRAELVEARDGRTVLVLVEVLDPSDQAVGFDLEHDAHDRRVLAVVRRDSAGIGHRQECAVDDLDGPGHHDPIGRHLVPRGARLDEVLAIAGAEPERTVIDRHEVVRQKRTQAREVVVGRCGREVTDRSQHVGVFGTLAEEVAAVELGHRGFEVVLGEQRLAPEPTFAVELGDDETVGLVAGNRWSRCAG